MTEGFDAVTSSALGVHRRRERAALKARIAAGNLNVLELFDSAEHSSDPVLAGLRVSAFLKAIPGVGQTKTNRILEQAGVLPTATLGGLRVRQRNTLRKEVVGVFRRFFPHLRGHLVIIVGPSGVGKGTIARWVLENRTDFVVSISATTRPPRAGEKEGDHYFFVTDKEFDGLVAEGELLEWAIVHRQYRYGTPQSAVEQQLDHGTNVILEIDIQGARAVKRKMPSAIIVFVQPPSFGELERRLATRGTEDPTDRKRRLRTARGELKTAERWDALITNHNVAEAGQSIVDLALASREARDFKE
jgi:guanylate kinase